MRLLRSIIPIILAVSFIAGLTACSGGGTGTTLTATVSPESPATISGAANIIISFNTSMNFGSLALAGSMAVESNGGVWSTVTNTDDTLTISPKTTWPEGSQNLIVDVKDTAGNILPTLSLNYTISATACVTDIDCPSNFFCSASNFCAVLVFDGVVCSGNNECQSGFCTDGVCCNATCGGTCESCALLGLEGSCGPVPAGSDPDGDCSGLFCDGSRSCNI